MNTSKIKTYAIQARRDFLKAVTERANIYSIFSDDHIESIAFKGDTAIIGERVFPKKEGELREKLVGRVKRDGFTMVMRACAYTWFNRFVALRYMEMHDSLEHGYRVLSSNDGLAIPEIIEHAADLEFQGLDKDKVIELKLAGTRDNELYRFLILSQCVDLHKSMPFLFDRIDSETELLLPDNLLHSDSPIRKMVIEIDELDWNDVEIIGWLYQFYISERKDEVIGKVVKNEDIPAATQLFTPNWIVKYMVQNTLGRMWMATYPDSPLKDKMAYYIEPAEQEPEVQKQLDAITPQELNPEEITFLDPACGSGHILVEAYDVLKEIYLERGYRTRDIPRLILEKNIFGLDICDRAAQLSCFAVLMKAREDDRRILGRDDLKLNVMAIQEAKTLDARNVELFFKGDGHKSIRSDLNEIVALFEQGKTFGSLITVPDHLAQRLESVGKIVEDKIGKWISQSDVQNLTALVKQARVLARTYDCVVTNPPYMGRKGMPTVLKTYIKYNYKRAIWDVYAAFIESSISFLNENGLLGMVAMHTWMFLPSFYELRSNILNSNTIFTLAHLGARAFDTISGEVVQTSAFILNNILHEGYYGKYFRLLSGNNENEKKELLLDQSNCFSHLVQEDFSRIPGAPISYWTSRKLLDCYICDLKISNYSISESLNLTGSNDKYLRCFWEVDKSSVGRNKKWLFYVKGGTFRKWYGNFDYVVNWSSEAIEFYRKDKTARIIPEYLWYEEGITWTKVTTGAPSFRYLPRDATYDVGGSSIIVKDKNDLSYIMCFLNSKVAEKLIRASNISINIQMGNIIELPLVNKNNEIIKNIYDQLFEIAMNNWDAFEYSWDFGLLPLLNDCFKSLTVRKSFDNWKTYCRSQIKRMQELENENNKLFINAYGLTDEITPEVHEEEISLVVPNDEIANKGLLSYAIGCMMGRYSLDCSGLIYADRGNEGFDPSKYKTFPADDDGIIPIMDQEWFPDDAANRFVEFMKVAWPPENLDENLKFVADSLKPKRNETSIDTIRRYLSTGFFKDHLKTYKKRPIYWLFSSGRQKAFECLVYLHRYNETTLSRMRSAYVTPLQGNFSARLQFLKDEKDAANTASAKHKFQKEMDKLQKKQIELSKFDDELRHYADMKISLDLDDGVKVNYSKFGKLLAEKKSITGKK